MFLSHLTFLSDRFEYVHLVAVGSDVETLKFLQFFLIVSKNELFFYCLVSLDHCFFVIKILQCGLL